MTYRIAPHRNVGGVYVVQQKFLWFWNTLRIKGNTAFSTLAEAEEALKFAVFLDKSARTSKERSRSWRRAVPAVYYDKNGKIVK
jgi:hypothetical protein